jgi:hypothetical protein
MHTSLRYSLFTLRSLLFLLLLAFPTLNAHAYDVSVPAGTLMECTLSEPSFSSATTSVGDPFLCYPRNIQEFGRPVFPRGTYFVGHLEDAKEPGHFVGKGYLKMAIDRIGLPTTDIPVRAKVISVAGYRVDKEGKVIGHGHATRDTVEWMLPPLWPWKILTLPAKGPRPTLKGEVRVTLRVMDDFIVPQEAAQIMQPPRLLPDRPRLAPQKGWHRFGSPANSPPQQVPEQIAQAVPAVLTNDTRASVTSSPDAQDAASLAAPMTIETANAWPASITVFALKNGTTIPVQQYWRDGDSLMYTLDHGEKVSVQLDSVDWSKTAHLNWQSGIRVSLRGAAPPDLKGE